MARFRGTAHGLRFRGTAPARVCTNGARALPGIMWVSGQLRSVLSYPKARLAAGLRLSMDPEGRIRTGISVVDSYALYRLSYLGVVPEVYPGECEIARWLLRTCPNRSSALGCPAAT